MCPHPEHGGCGHGGAPKSHDSDVRAAAPSGHRAATTKSPTAVVLTTQRPITVAAAYHPPVDSSPGSATSAPARPKPAAQPAADVAAALEARVAEVSA